MPALADLERILERVFERTTARLFRARPQVVQVEHKVERAMERARTQQASWTVVPSRYRVRLNPDDLAVLAADAGGAEALAARLADATLAFARSHGYHLAGRPSVAIVADPAVERAEIEVDAVADRGRPISLPENEALTPGDDVPTPWSGVPPGPDVPPEPVEPAPAPASVVGHNVPDTPIVGSPSQVPAMVAALSEDPSASADPPADGAPPTVDPAGSRSASIRREATETLIFRKPAPPEARASLRVTTADGKERMVEVGGAPVSIGRSTDNAIVLPDSRVSRHHGRLQTRRGTLVYTDLGSTNGSRVNGVRVDECALGIGDRIVVGDTVLLVEQLPA